MYFSDRIRQGAQSHEERAAPLQRRLRSLLPQPGRGGHSAEDAQHERRHAHRAQPSVSR